MVMTSREMLGATKGLVIAGVGALVMLFVTQEVVTEADNITGVPILSGAFIGILFAFGITVFLLTAFFV